MHSGDQSSDLIPDHTNQILVKNPPPLPVSNSTILPTSERPLGNPPSSLLAHPRVPFVIGITGNMDPVGYDDDRATCEASPQMIDLRQRILSVFDWVRSGSGSLNHTTGKFCSSTNPPMDVKDPSGNLTEFYSCWKPLGLRNSPILILSSLAPGIDTLVVEAALDYATKHPDASISILAPLPFPADVYCDASTFNTEGKKKRFDELRARLDKSRLFEVALDNDLLNGDPNQARLDLDAQDLAFDKPRRHLRYRAAGEYVAAHSDLLLAVFDEALDQPKLADLFEAGSATIVESKRTGLTHELLAVANNFAWSDNGPVLVLPVKRQKRDKLPPEEATALAEPGPMKFLHPYDLRPAASIHHNDAPAWQQAGDARFRRVLIRQERFNCLPANSKEDGELSKLLGPDAAKNEEALAFARTLDPIARVRRRAADESAALQKKRDRLLLWLLWLIAVAALSFGAFEHWHHHLHHPHESNPLPWFVHDVGSRIQCGLLIISFACLAISGVRYYRYRKSGTEENRYDYRSIGEALKVQFYWQLAGTGRSVSADYMQRQRDELDWIRYIVSSLSMPFEVPRRTVLGLGKDARVTLLKATHKQWIAEQMNWFPGKASRCEKFAHKFHARGWTFATGGLLSMVGMFLAELFPRLDDFLKTHHWEVALPGLLVGGLFFLVLKRRKSSHDHVEAGDAQERTGFLRWIFGDGKTWGAALAIASFIFGASFALGKITHYWPDEHNWWIILAGASLLVGGLSIAWAERNFYSEEARQYRSMANLFGCADRRLESLIHRYEEASIGSANEKRLLFEIQDIFYQIGCEALNENAEWLIQHRARPLEPFMAG